jgi:hypothetical protein
VKPYLLDTNILIAALSTPSISPAQTCTTYTTSGSSNSGRYLCTFGSSYTRCGSSCTVTSSSTCCDTGGGGCSYGSGSGNCQWRFDPSPLFQGALALAGATVVGMVTSS